MDNDQYFVKISPDGARYAMELAGWNAKELAKKMETPAGTISGWLKGKDASVIDLEKAGRIMDIPVSYFFIKDPPKTAHPTDRRDKNRGIFGRKLLKALMNIKRRQNIAMELMEGMQSTLPTFTNTFRFPINSSVLTYWDLRRRMEKSNMFVMECDMGDDADGIMLVEGKKPFIAAINTMSKSKTVMLAKLYAHAIVDEDGICILGENGDALEELCDTFAKDFTATFTIPPDSELPLKYPNTLDSEILEALDKYGEKYTALIAGQAGTENVSMEDFTRYLGLDKRHLKTINDKIRA